MPPQLQLHPLMPTPSSRWPHQTSTLPSSNTTTELLSLARSPLLLPGAYQTKLTTARLTAAISLSYETSVDRQPLQASGGDLAGLLLLTTSAPDTYHLRIIAAPTILDPDNVRARHPTALVGVTDTAAFTRSTTPTGTDFVDDLSFTTVRLLTSSV